MKTLIEQYDEVKYKLKESIFSFGHDKRPVLIHRISNEWEPFGLIEGDSGKMVEVFENSFIAALKTPKGKVVRHYKKVRESGLIVKGYMRVTLPDKSYTVRAGESYQIGAGVWREIEFLGEENHAIAQFYPPFKKDWEVTI